MKCYCASQNTQGALLLKLSSKLQDEELSQTFFLSLIKAAPSPPLKAILFNIYKKSSPTPANAAAVLTPFLDEMASLSSDSPDLIPTLMDSRDIYHECVIYLAQNPSAFDPSTVAAAKAFSKDVLAPHKIWQLDLLSDALDRLA
jgi:hypothetical protein